MRIIRFNELQTQLWKNGGGVTREIAALRIDGKMIWRISLADVKCDGPFSSFPSLTRILTVIEGAGIRLTSNEGTVNALYGMPVRFDGGLAINSKLIGGPIRDLNVIFDAALCDAKVVLAIASLSIRAGGNMAIIGLAGQSRINSNHDLQFGDTALMENQGCELQLAEGATALVVALKLSQK